MRNTILMVISLLFCALSASAQDRDTALVGYWKFDESEGTTAYDSSGCGNDGTLMNGPAWALGISGNALDSDGTDDYVEVADSPSLDVAGPFTTMCWVYPRHLPRGFTSFINKWMNYILQTGEFGPRRLRLIFRDSEGQSYCLESPDNILTLDEWQHIAGLWDGDSLKLFRNGREVASAYVGPAVPDPTSTLLCISAENGTWQFFNGKIDEVKVYSRALSAEEISREFEKPSLVGFWTFDRGIGDTAYDSSPYGNHGTLVNGPARVAGISGNALDLDGTDDYVEVADSPSLDVAGPFTTMCWVYPRHLPRGFTSFINKWMNYILQTGEFGPRRLRLIFRDSEGQSYCLESPDNILTLDEWQHIAGLWDGDSLKLFRNGREVASAYVGPAVPDPTSTLLCISAENGTWQFFNGKIDEVKVYSRALSAEEMKAEFESGVARGDTNGDGIINIGDVVYLVSYLYKNGPAPDPSESGDVTCDGIADIGDVVFLVAYLYRNGPPPPSSC